ncbi:hypothetical protein BKA62DRAFT_693344 [Auriculariales sp. MPI-PUGE-AT-0066]|nr:hypothetical protein BKA62DRAFT_693344 [Auriculariales sp. MPI-PUGE-AT-0066]
MRTRAYGIPLLFKLHIHRLTLYLVTLVVVVCVLLKGYHLQRGSGATVKVHDRLPAQLVIPAEQQSIPELLRITSQTRGFYARDFPLYIGWNNIKYIIESAILQAELLNRTAVLPSFVYARGCVLTIAACAAFLPMVNRNDAFRMDRWRHLPKDLQMAWKVPLEVMINLSKLRNRHRIILVSEYLRLQGLSPSLETTNGHWDTLAYHNTSQPPSLYILSGPEHDIGGRIVVDKYPETGRPAKPRTPIFRELENFAHKLEDQALNWAQVGQVLGRDKSRRQLERELLENDWVPTYTFHSPAESEMFKAPIFPIMQAVSRIRVRGWREFYGRVTDDVFLMTGEVHLRRKPGGMRFLRKSDRDDFARIVLHDMVYNDEIHELADILERRMRDRVEGRHFLAAHIRRDDFLRISWSPKVFKDHWERVDVELKKARQILRDIRHQNLTTYDVPDVEKPDAGILSREPPLDNDPCLIMTDERSSEDLDYLRAHGAIFVKDLLLPEERHVVGWPMLLADVFALVEQSLVARSDYFVGQKISSLAAGVVAMRAARGLDPQTAVLF